MILVKIYFQVKWFMFGSFCSKVSKEVCIPDPNLKATSKLPFARNRVGNVFTFEIIAKCETECVKNTFSV